MTRIDTPFKIEGHRWDQVLYVENRSYLSLPYWTPQAVTWEGFDFRREPETCWFRLVGVPDLSAEVFCRKIPNSGGVSFGSPVAHKNGARERDTNGEMRFLCRPWEDRLHWDLADSEEAASFLRLLRHHQG